DTAELVRVLREQAKKDSAKIFLPVDVYPEWQAAAALEATQARADKLEAELAEAKREIERLRENHRVAVHRKRVTGEYRDDFKARAEAAEASLAAAKERVKKLAAGIEAVHTLIADSEGVTGLHKNGDVAPWNEIRTGGRFEE